LTDSIKELKESQRAKNDIEKRYEILEDDFEKLKK